MTKQEHQNRKIEHDAIWAAYHNVVTGNRACPSRSDKLTRLNCPLNDALSELASSLCNVHTNTLSAIANHQIAATKLVEIRKHHRPGSPLVFSFKMPFGTGVLEVSDDAIHSKFFLTFSSVFHSTPNGIAIYQIRSDLDINLRDDLGDNPSQLRFQSIIHRHLTRLFSFSERWSTQIREMANLPAGTLAGVNHIHNIIRED